MASMLPGYCITEEASDVRPETSLDPSELKRSLICLLLEGTRWSRCCGAWVPLCDDGVSSDNDNDDIDDTSLLGDGAGFFEGGGGVWGCIMKGMVPSVSLMTWLACVVSRALLSAAG